MSLQGAKPKSVEELIDFYFHRRLAVPVVAVAARLKFSPNQITWLSLLFGCFSAYLYYRGQFPLGSLALLAAIVLDCSDGMLARVTGTSSPVGRILDGFFDLIWVVLVWIAVYLGQSFSPPKATVLLLMISSGASMFLHCMTYDSVKSTYLTLCEPDSSEKNLSWREARKRSRESFGRRRFFEALIYLVMSLHHACLVSSPHKAPALGVSDRSRAQRNLAPSMRLWSFLGEGTHLALIFMAGLITPWFQNAFLAACAVMLIPLNLLWLVAAILWRRDKRRVLADTR